MQNVVMRTRHEAREARCAPFELSVCTNCGLAFNSLFSADLLQYDERYDNDVPSTAFDLYYREIAMMLRDTVPLDGGIVYDVGCGKGAFLDALCGVAAGISGVGIDPSCTPQIAGKYSLIRAAFSANHLTSRPQLLLCRHVLEHIEEPTSFVRVLSEGCRAYPSTPVYFEVPELEWIFRNGAFWDFCYEHCNYFTQFSLAATLRAGGVICDRASTSFQGQYQWTLGRTGSAERSVMTSAASDVLEASQRYAEWEHRRVDEVRQVVDSAAASGSCVLWGMATKGVVFANIIDPLGEILAGGVDVNTKKQGCFVPGTGHGIHPPLWLKTLQEPVTIVVMNPNYMGEICEQVQQLGVRGKMVAF